MDFFKSVFSADPDDEEAGPTPADPSPAASGSGAGGAAAPWDLGGLMKTLATRSESVIQTYKKDLSEFGSELKKETAAIRSVAARAVLDLPGSLEAGASAAHDSLESVGQAIDDLGGTVRALLLSPDPPDAAEPDSPAPSKRYSRFDAQLLSLQSDPSTFDDVPNTDDYSAWKSGFDLSTMEEEIEILCYENPTLEAIFQKMVPGAVDYDTFWSRYYYRVNKLKQAEDARANLVKRAISREEEDEELTWEVDDDEDEEEDAAVKKEVIVTDEVPEEEVKEVAGSSEVKTVHEAGVTIDEAVTVIPEDVVVAVTGDEESVVMPAPAGNDGVLSSPAGNDGVLSSPAGNDGVLSTPAENDGVLSSPAEVKVDPAEVKVDPAESSKDSDFSVVSSQPSMPEEDDLGWDEIEDLGDNDDKKVVSSGGSPSRVDLRKRLSAAEDDEDLSWDFEEDEDPTKP